MRFLRQLAFILASKTYQNRVLEASWGVWGASWRPLGASWERLGASWAHVGASCGRLGASWSVFERLERVFRRPGRVQTEIIIASEPSMHLRLAPGKPNYQDGGNLTNETLHRKTTYRECMRVSV